MSRALSRWQAILLGLVVLTGLGLAGFGLFAVGSRQWFWSDELRLRVGFPAIQGVEQGTRVRVQGVDAGEVARIEMPAEPGAPVLLHLRLKGEFRRLVRADAKVRIASEGMLGAKVVELLPGSPGADPVADNALLASDGSGGLDGLVGQVGEMVEALGREKDRFHEVVENANRLMTNGADAALAMRQVADGIKEAPLVRDYVEDPVKILHRPDCERNRQVFAAEELFAPGQSTLTTAGKAKLDGLGPWLNGLTTHTGSEVVVAALADPKDADRTLARSLTTNQARAVCDYLKQQGNVYKKFWLFSRPVKPLGLGADPSPVPEREPLPSARVEILVFVPQK